MKINDISNKEKQKGNLWKWGQNKQLLTSNSNEAMISGYQFMIQRIGKHIKQKNQNLPLSLREKDW